MLTINEREISRGIERREQKKRASFYKLIRSLLTETCLMIKKRLKIQMNVDYAIN